jgi:hypothetical protein
VAEPGVNLQNGINDCNVYIDSATGVIVKQIGKHDR